MTERIHAHDGPAMPCFGGFVAMLCLLASSLGATAATRAARPDRAIEQAGCVTAECHASVKGAKVLHGPISANSCDACHNLLDAKAHTFQVKRKGADLCTYCHEFDTHGKGTVHKPVANGECLGCHDPHGGPAKSLVRDASMSDLCARCHDKAARDRKFVHTPVSKGACDSCHAPHASKFPKLLDVIGSDLCLTCHTDFDIRMARSKFRHKALDKGCTRCHDAHGSQHPTSLVKAAPELCLSCHEKVKDAIAAAKDKHSVVVTDRACTTCHTPHAGELAKLLSNQPIKLCMTCHDKPIKPKDGRAVAAVAEVIDPKLVKHGPIKEGQCDGCHTVHGSERPLLLAKSYSKTFYQHLAPQNYELCLNCHDVRLIQDPKGMTGFRNGETNLHFLHVSKGARDHNCRACHVIHASGSEKLIREWVQFGKWQMPIKFQKTATGGTCAPGCHVAYGYDREKPVKGPLPAVGRGQMAVVRDVDEPVIVTWKTKDIGGAEVTVPDAGRPTVLVFVGPEHVQSERAMKLVGLAVGETKKAQVIVVVCGSQAQEQAKAMAAAKVVAWPIVADGDYAACTQLGVTGWPATLVLKADGVKIAHIGGAPESLAMRLEPYVDFAAGRIDKAAMEKEQNRRPVMDDGPEKKAARQAYVAQRLLEEGKAEQAAKLLAEALAAQPDSVALRVGLIKAHLQAGRANEALDMIDRMAGDKIPLAQRNLLRGKAVLMQQKWDVAKRLLLLAVKEDGGLLEAHYLLGQIYDHEQDWQRAAGAYKAATTRPSQ